MSKKVRFQNPPVQPVVAPQPTQVEKIYENVIEPGFGALGIGVRNSPLRRFVVVSLATGLLVWTVKPEYLFDSNGNPRPFFSGKDGISMPWWAFSLLMGGASVLFI